MLAMIIAAAAAQQPAEPRLSDALLPMAFLVHRCWVAELKRGAETDTHCFEPVYGGKHLRDRHEVKNSAGKVTYGGETLYSWNGNTKRIEFTYVNSIGGVSHGTVKPVDGGLDFGDQVYNGPDGTELKISTLWKRTGDAGYESVSRSSGHPTGERVVAYRRVD